MAIADSATPVVGAGGHAELSKALDAGFEDELAGSAANEEGPDEDDIPDDVLDADPDDISDEDADLILSALEDIDARLAKLEDQAAQEAR